LLDLNSVEIVQNANVSVVLVFSIVFILGCLLTPFFTAKLFEEKNITIFAITVLSGMNLVVKKFATAKVVLSKSGEKMSVLTTARNMVINTASSVSKALSKFTTKSKEKSEQQEEKRIR
jgi:Kef-type K+ transport system membrane component KefB